VHLSIIAQSAIAPKLIMSVLRFTIVLALAISLYLGGAFSAYALLPGQRYYDYYNPSSHPPYLLNSVRINHLLRAETTLRSKDPSRLHSAFADLGYVLNYFPNHPQALSLMVQVGLEAKYEDKVEKYLDDAIKTFPNTASTWAIQGTYKARIGHLVEAIESYRQALRLEPYDMQTHYNLGLAYADKKEWDKANEQAQIAYRLGAPKSGLRERLMKVGAWKPGSDFPTEASSPDIAKPDGASKRVQPPSLGK
jgi:tetratricopeptide (TPR) repeat protein